MTDADLACLPSADGILLAEGQAPEMTVLPKAGSVLLMALDAIALGACDASGRSTRYARRLALGLLFCAGGDACLELEHSKSLAPMKEGLFLAGLGCFLIGHLLYVWAFTANRFKLRPIVVSPLMGYVLCVFLVLQPHLPTALLAPVFIYACAIGWMVVLACSRQPAGTHSQWSKRSAVCGALIFTVSDTVLALNKFVSPIQGAKGIVMATYFLGQAAIAASARGAGGKPVKSKGTDGTASAKTKKP